MKDAKGHGSDPRGAHAQGTTQVGVTKTVPIESLHHGWDVLEHVKGDPQAEKTYMATVNAIRGSIQAGKPIDPIYVSKSGRVIDGHHRLYAYQAEGVKQVPVQVLRGKVWDTMK